MFARVNIVEGSPDKVDEGIRQAREETLPAAKGDRGFKGMYMLVDRKTGKLMGITLWETEADLKASAQGANRLRAQFARTVAAAPAKVEIYEVAVQP